LKLQPLQEDYDDAINHFNPIDSPAPSKTHLFDDDIEFRIRWRDCDCS